jgi:NAD(P)-dependent dehydrogenase (short-subunit alcohol dehydrogenase family)
MQIKDSVILITGANRGLGLEFAKQAISRGAKRVYAGARTLSSIQLEGVVPIQLDVTSPEQIAAALAHLSDVTLLINNAGIARPGGLLDQEGGASLQEHLLTNMFGILSLSQALAPTLARNGGGVILNVLSVLSWVNTPILSAYGVSKAAAWALTNGLRLELRGQGTQVVGLHAGFIDTDMARPLEVPKARPQDVVRLAFDAIESGSEEVFVDEPSRQVHGALSGSIYLKDVLAG